MLIPNHPDSERLSALASNDTDATTDRTLTDHVSSCRRCTDVVNELGALRASLAELPDLQPHRPLRLLPEVEPAPASAADRLGGWAKRFFAPVLTAGAALALVGAVGTVGPTLGGLGASGAAPQEAMASDGTTLNGEAGGAPTPATVRGLGQPGASGGSEAATTDDGSTAGTPDDSTVSQPFSAAPERSPWPMVLFTGIALMIAAALLRWILAPRAG